MKTQHEWVDAWDTKGMGFKWILGTRLGDKLMVAALGKESPFMVCLCHQRAIRLPFISLAKVNLSKESTNPRPDYTPGSVSRSKAISRTVGIGAGKSWESTSRTIC